MATPKVQSSSSQRRIEANRRNAQKSTGPRTPEGKARCARNALRHGLTASLGLLPGEDPVEFEQFEREMLDELKPVGPLQRAFAGQVVWAAWRLRRVPLAESAVMRRQERERVDGWERRQARRAQFGAMLAPSLGLGGDEPPPRRRSAEQVLADRFTDARHDPLARVEAHALRLQRSFLSSLRALQQLQKCGQEAIEAQPEDGSDAPAGGSARFCDDQTLTANDPTGATEVGSDTEPEVGGAEPAHVTVGMDPSTVAVARCWELGSGGSAGAGRDEPSLPAFPDGTGVEPGGAAPSEPAAVQNEANAGGHGAAHPAAGEGVVDEAPPRSPAEAPAAPVCRVHGGSEIAETSGSRGG